MDEKTRGDVVGSSSRASDFQGWESGFRLPAKSILDRSRQDFRHPVDINEGICPPCNVLRPSSYFCVLLM